MDIINIEKSKVDDLDNGECVFDTDTNKAICKHDDEISIMTQR